MLQKVILGTVMLVLAGVGALMILSLLGSALESAADWQIEHERCLKRATNGYDAARCR